VRKRILLLFKTTRVFNVITKTDFDEAWICVTEFFRDWLQEGYRVRLIDNGFSFALGAHWYTFFISTCMYSTAEYLLPAWRIRRKIARRAKRNAETGRTKAHFGGREKRVTPREKMVLSALDEIWIVCYNLRVAYAAAFLKANTRSPFW